jgi:hypothetical protein
MRNQINKILCIAIVFLLPLTSLAQEVQPGFDAGKLVDDKVFTDTLTFGGAEGVQKFLEVKGSILANTNPDFLIKLKEPSSVSLKQGLEDPQPGLGKLRTAAELIWDASRQSGLNPQVIIVTLNKEQSLITGHKDSGPEKLQRALDFALGFGCPDSTGCSQSLFPGFYYQLFGNFDAENNRYLGAAKSLMKSYSTDGGRGPTIDQQGNVFGDTGEKRTAKVGDVLIIPNTMGPPFNAPPSTIVTLTNRATAALYRYTPHVFNGNYNFWRFFQEWFKYPNGTIIKLGSAVDYYIIQDGTKQLVPSFVAIARSLNIAAPTVVSPTEFESYPSDKVLGPADNTIVNVIGENKTYVFLQNVKRPASNFVISQRGLDPKKALSISATESALFPQGDMLTPKDGTVIRGTADQTVYLVEGGKLKSFSAFTFGQKKLTAKNITTVPDGEIASYTKAGWVAPNDGSLIKSGDDGTVYIVSQGLKQPMTYEIFVNRGYSFKNVGVLKGEELSALPMGMFATPKDKSWFQDSNKQLYLFKDGSKHAISGFVAKQRKITPDYTFNADMVMSWQTGLPYTPKDNTLLKGESDGTVYVVLSGQLRPLTGTAFKNRKYNFKNVVTLPQAEIDAYGKGDTIEK